VKLSCIGAVGYFLWQYSNNKWSNMLSLKDDWVFQPSIYRDFEFPPTLHVGDYNMDGFPDVVTVLFSPTSVMLSSVCLVLFASSFHKS